MFCPYCGTSRDRKRFCTQCGRALPGIQSAATKKLFGQTDSAPKTVVLTGLTLDQKYRLESKLGEGGTGAVYLAKRLLIGDSAAIKVLHPDQTSHDKAVERFHREAQIAARLKHENVVNVYDFGVSRDGLVYLVMELAEGISLRRMIEEQGRLTQTVAAEIMSRICAAIDDAHRQGIIHRDLKPENILVNATPRGLQVKVLDFGISAQREIVGRKLTRTGGVIGTPHYMSPEQCKGEELDGRSDVYSLGIVLFEMLTGVLPFNTTTPTAIVVQQVNQAPPPLREINSEISPAVESVVLRALAKQPDARPQTAGELARELNDAIKGAASTPISAISAAVSGSRRKAALAVASLLLLAAIVGARFGLRWGKNGGDQPVANDVQQIASVGGPSSASNPNAPNSGFTTPAMAEPVLANNNLWEVIPDQTRNTTDAAFALGGADRRMALIKPGGQLALNYREGGFFGEGAGPDVHLYGPEQGQVSYVLFVRDDPSADWRQIDINHKGFNQGMACHDMGHHGVRQARQLMIRNEGNADLSIDGAAVSYKDKAPEGSRSHEAPLKTFARDSVTAHHRLLSAPMRLRSASQSAHLKMWRKHNI